MINKNAVLNEVERLGYELGCYHTNIDLLGKTQLKKVLAGLKEEATDVKVKFLKKDYVVEIFTVDNEKDLNWLSAEEYLRLYGEEV